MTGVLFATWKNQTLKFKKQSKTTIQNKRKLNGIISKKIHCLSQIK